MSEPRTTEDRARASGHADEILSMLIAAGERGCTNSELWTICHAVNSRISDLRKKFGYRIESKSEGGGVWRYTLLADVAPTSPAEPEWKDRPRATGLELFDAAVRK